MLEPQSRQLISKVETMLVCWGKMDFYSDFREGSLFMGGGAVQIGGGINFSASKLRGGKLFPLYNMFIKEFFLKFDSVFRISLAF